MDPLDPEDLRECKDPLDLRVLLEPKARPETMVPQVLLALQANEDWLDFPAKTENRAETVKQDL